MYDSEWTDFLVVIRTLRDPALVEVGAFVVRNEGRA